MIARVILWSIHNRLLVLLVTVILVVWGVIAVKQTPLDAIPDLSDLQVIIKTTFPGQAPEVVEDQVTYPITTAMLSVPRTTAVRGYSFYSDSYVYVVFEEGTDIYWARARVLEYLSQITGQLPPTVKPKLGPDATGVGWIYEYALIDRSGQHDLSQLRSLQDWFLKYELQTVPGVSEVATVGGMVKQYQVVLNPDKMRAYSLPVGKIKRAIERANQEVGGSVIELAEAEYMIRAKGYIQSLDDIRQIPISINKTGTPLLLGDVAKVRIGPQMRRGVAELNGQGEVVGGIVVMRWGENALTTIAAVKQKMAALMKGLPEGVEIIVTYDRSNLIQRSVTTLLNKLMLEFVVVAIVCFVFLGHLRSALVAIVILPLGILMAYIVMSYQQINANIMSLGGIAIAIGAMLDAAIVMIENVHKRLEKFPNIGAPARWQAIQDATIEVGPALFFSLLIITLSFIPVLALEAQEGKLFAPLAYTKTYAMAAAAALSVTLLPILMGYMIRGKIPAEHKNPLNRFLMALYLPMVRWTLQWPKVVIFLCGLLVTSIVVPLSLLEWSFMPELDEGDLLYMPTTFAGISVGKAAELLQITDRLIKENIPEAITVFGKVGRAETATDPAPLTMIETTIQLKPKSEWREGLTLEKLKQELEHIVNLPGLTNAWVMPIKTRIDMITTGIKSPIGIKVTGADLKVIAQVTEQIEAVVKQIPGASQIFAERVTGGRYIDINIDRQAAARYGLNIMDVQEVISLLIGGANITHTVEGLERYPVNLRYARDVRDSIDKLTQLPIITPQGMHVPLGEVATFEVTDGAGIIKSENARRAGWVLVGKVVNRDLSEFIAQAQQEIAEKVTLPPGYSIGWVGEYENLLRVKEKMSFVVPLTLGIILILLFMHFGTFVESLMVLGSVPLALVGALWLVYFLSYDLSVAVSVGLIALAGVAVEFGVVMLVYLNQAVALIKPTDVSTLKKAIIYGAVLRVRPKAMTATVIIAGLLPILIGGGTGSEVMSRIAAPMLGGMITAPLVSMILIPAFYLLWKRKEFGIT